MLRSTSIGYDNTEQIKAKQQCDVENNKKKVYEFSFF